MSDAPFEEDEKLPVQSTRSHMHEFAQRLTVTFGGSVLAVIPFTLGTTRVLRQYPPHSPDLMTSDGFLWGILCSLVLLHYLLLHNLVAFVTPGLYRHERKMMIVPAAWFALCPFLAVLAMSIANVPLSAAARAWLVRAYVIASGIPLVLYLPRRARGISISAYSAAVVLLIAVPDHVCDSLIVGVFGVAFILSLVASLALIITSWPD